MWVLAGIALSVFCREHFVRNCSGELIWWHRRHPHGAPKTPLHLDH